MNIDPPTENIIDVMENIGTRIKYGQTVTKAEEARYAQWRETIGKQTDATQALIRERGKTHGDFNNHAGCTQDLKRVIFIWCTKSGKAYDMLDPIVRESLDMIAHKIGRIVAGDPMFKDHWDDIAGYARLVSERIK